MHAAVFILELLESKIPPKISDSSLYSNKMLIYEINTKLHPPNLLLQPIIAILEEALVYALFCLYKIYICQ